MDSTPNEAPAAAQAAESVATPNTNENTAQAPAMPDMHGFTSEELAEMRKFYDNNGGFEKVKARISNPEPKSPEQPAPVQPQAQPQPQPVAQPQQPMRTPDGMLSRNDLLMRGYYERLAGEEEFKPIAKEIIGGDVLKEMEMLGINPTDSNGFIDDRKIRAFLSIKAKTVPASQTNSMPEASPAPTVDYVQVGDTIENMAQARAVIMQDSQLRASGLAGHPSVAKAEEFLRNALNKNNK